MGSQFAIVFDIITVAVIILMFFSGWRRGFVNVILGLCASVVAFMVALFVSTPIAEAVYANYVEKPLTQNVDELVDKSFSTLSLGNFTEVDYDSVYISGVAANKLELDYLGRDSAVVDLSNVDVSVIGLTVEDLEMLGLEPTYNLRSVNLKTAEFSKSDVDKYGLGKLAVAHFIAVNLIDKGDFSEFNSFAVIISDYIPSAQSSSSTSSVTVSFARRLVLGMLETRTTVIDTVMQSFIRPNCIIVIRTVSFALIYAIVFAILKVIASASKLIEKIPVIGDLNSLLGGAAGVIEGLVIVFLLCLAVRLAVTLTDGSAIMFNQETIDNTFIFKRIYEFDFLKFLT